MENSTANKKAYEHVFDYFFEQILSGDLKLNDRIPTERDLAERLGVSRNSAREALHVLEMMGLVECLQGSGNYVRCDTHDYMLKFFHMCLVLQQASYTEVLEMRRWYEAGAIEMAMSCATAEELESLHQILISMDQADSLEEGSRLDLAFHNSLVLASHNRLLSFYTALFNELLDQFIRSLRTTILLDGAQAQLLQQSHWAIYNALMEKDLDAGLAALEQHFKIDRDYIAQAERSRQ
ncbi:MAG: FadR family transcriptional regulator [Clostridiales bacterium]|nr:FadR family transcriptional regulator [Clostridiales bacterium]